MNRKFSDPATDQSSAPIFILGISPRCGTNFLSNLIRQHPDCGAPGTIWEDYLVAHSDMLNRYTNLVFRRWHWRSGRAAPDAEMKLRNAIGDGLVQFLSSEIRSRRLVTKTPDVSNLDHFFEYFPDAYLLILVRDGRAVVESRVRTFGESYHTAMRKWVDAARTIRRFQDSQSVQKGQFLVVKYEDLWRDVTKNLRRILAFCDLPPEAYSYEDAVNLPVRGSSVHHGENRTDIHWEPIKKTKDFDPTQRFKHWSKVMHEEFNTVAGKEMDHLGYSVEKVEQTVFGRLFLNPMRVLGGDLEYYLLQKFRSIRRSLVKGSP